LLLKDIFIAHENLSMGFSVLIPDITVERL
jgi:hypothetical protein